MSWLCKLRHKWSYSDNKVNLKIGHLTIKKRRCLRCYKSQVYVMSPGQWQDIELTRCEIRDIKLKKLGL